MSDPKPLLHCDMKNDRLGGSTSTVERILENQTKMNENLKVRWDSKILKKIHFEENLF